MARIDTRNYNWSECEIRFNGRLLTSVQGVAWNHKQEKTAIYGKGNKALAIQEGNESVDGSLTLMQSELEALLDECPENKAIRLKNADLQVAFNDGEQVVRYTIKGIAFTEEPHDHKQNDPVAISTMPFLALDSTRIA